MGFFDKMRGTVGGKAEELSAKVAQSYREHLGEELLKKQKELIALEARLKSREDIVSKREANLKKYYLLPRLYIQLPIALVSLILVYNVYQAFKPEIKTESGPANSVCFVMGVAYYTAIGSYPKLSTGEDADSKIEGMCGRSNGMAFGKEGYQSK
jgi:hypothetical protein